MYHISKTTMRIYDIDKKFPRHSFNARLLLKEMAKRGIQLSSIGNTRMVQAVCRSHKEYLYDIYSNIFSYTKGLVIDDKYYSKKYLSEKNISVTPGKVFDNYRISQATDYAQEIGFPVVFKPTMSSHGENVITDILDKKFLRCVINKYIRQYIRPVYYLIEKQFGGKEYRLFITKNNYFAAVHRIPASITGDGEHKISDLIKMENIRRMHPRNTCLCEIPIDDIMRVYLERQNLSLSSIPSNHQVIKLRNNSNVSTGGNCVDITDMVHPSYIRLAKKIIKLLNIPFVGIDLICPDITKKINQYIICELNSSPGLSLHMLPEVGVCRNVAKSMVDLIFPETKKYGN
jgi:cyanophycin synthetase